MVGGKVDGQILFGTRSEKPKILFGTRDEKRKIYLAPNDSYDKFYLAVKGLISRITKDGMQHGETQQELSRYHHHHTSIKFFTNDSLLEDSKLYIDCLWH